MKRRIVAGDRVAVVVLGLLLLGAGVALVLWSAGRLASGGAVDTRPAADVSRQWWWAAALALAGLLLLLWGLRWLLGHIPRRRISTVSLSTPDTHGPATPAVVDMGALASAFAEDLASRPGISSARGRAVHEGGAQVLEAVARLDDEADLAAASASANAAIRSLATVTEGRTDGTARVRLRV